MILRIIGLCWMIAPFLVLLIPNNNVGELLPYAATSFILGFLCFKATPKHKKKSTDIIKPKKKTINADKPLNIFSHSRKFEKENHERFVPKPSKLDEYQSNYSESIKLVENIGNDTYRPDVNKGVYDLIRNGKDYPGETSRILTESYFGVGYVKDDRIESMENLISFRTAIYSYLGLNENLPDNLAIDYCNNFPMVIFCLAYFEIYNIPDKKEFFEKHQFLIYKIIETEHIKIAERMKKVPVVSKCSDIEIKRALNKISNSFLEIKQTNGSSEYEIIKRMIDKEIYDIEPEPNLETFQRELYQQRQSASYDQQFNGLIRNNPETHGEDARILTQMYFEEFYEGEDNPYITELFLLEINQTFKSEGIPMKEEFIRDLSLSYYHTLPPLIFALVTYPRLRTENFMYYLKISPLIYRIVLEEFNKTYPLDKQYDETDLEGTGYSMVHYVFKNN